MTIAIWKFFKIDSEITPETIMFFPPSQPGGTITGLSGHPPAIIYYFISYKSNVRKGIAIARLLFCALGLCD
jgi:hypothetical protein